MQQVEIFRRCEKPDGRAFYMPAASADKLRAAQVADNKKDPEDRENPYYKYGIAKILKDDYFSSDVVRNGQPVTQYGTTAPEGYEKQVIGIAQLDPDAVPTKDKVAAATRLLHLEIGAGATVSTKAVSDLPLDSDGDGIPDDEDDDTASAPMSTGGGGVNPLVAAALLGSTTKAGGSVAAALAAASARKPTGDKPKLTAEQKAAKAARKAESELPKADDEVLVVTA